MSNTQTELEVLIALVPQLEAEGYEVYLHPSRPMVPEFLGDFQPDVLAFRGDEKLVVEIKRKSKDAEKQMQQISKLLQGRSGWNLRLIWLSPTSELVALPRQTRETIKARIEEARALVSAIHVSAAMLLAWATFEAIARALSEASFNRPQTPGRLIEVLAAEGTISPSEADLLRRLAQLRNRLIHGELTVTPDQGEVERFLDMLSDLSEEFHTLNQGTRAQIKS